MKQVGVRVTALEDVRTEKGSSQGATVLSPVTHGDREHGRGQCRACEISRVCRNFQGRVLGGSWVYECGPEREDVCYFNTCRLSDQDALEMEEARTGADRPGWSPN